MPYARAPAPTPIEAGGVAGAPPRLDSHGSLSFRASGAFAPAAILGGAWVFWLGTGGGYFPDVWYPSALGAVALLIVSAAARGRAMPKVRAARVALMAFGALVGFNYLSILWANAPGLALQEANQLLLYLAVGWTFAILPWTPRALGIALGCFSLLIGAFCAVGLARATSGSDLTGFFDELRYATPLDYPNATAALAVIGAWPALIFSVRRELPWPVRVGLLGLAVFLFEFAFLPQSRAAVVGVVLTAALVLAVCRDRFALLIRMAIVGGGLAVTLPRTVRVDRAVTSGAHVQPVLQHAASGIWLTTLGALALGGLLVLIQSGLASRKTRVRSGWRPGRRVARAAALILLVAGIGGAVAAEPKVAHLAQTVYRSGRTDASTGSTRLFSSTPEERFDYARVALHAFSGAPILGVGAGNFALKYDALRRFQKHSRYTHDLPLRVLSETGAVGFLLFLTMIGSLLVGLLRAGTELPGVGRTVAEVSLVVSAVFLVHASLDWLEKFPALAAPALAFPLAAIAMRHGDESSPERARRTRWHRRAAFPPWLARLRWLAGIAVLDVVVVVCVGGPYLATRYAERGLATFRSRPSSAYRDFSRAADLNPLSADPLIQAGTVALNLQESTRARAAFLRAIQREDQWFPHLELALVDAEAGQFSTAAQELARARALDATDAVLNQAQLQIREHRRIDPAGFNSLLLQGAEADVFRHQSIK